MTQEYIKQCIFNVLNESGIYIDECEKNKDIDLREYLVDSLQYVNFIIEMEAYLGYELPDEVLAYESLASINGFANMIIGAHSENG